MWPNESRRYDLTKYVNSVKNLTEYLKLKQITSLVDTKLKSGVGMDMLSAGINETPSLLHMQSCKLNHLCIHHLKY